MTKGELRKKLKNRRQSMTVEEMNQASRLITKKILESDVYLKSKTVFAYISMPGEPDTIALIGDALRQGKKVCVPGCFSAEGQGTEKTETGKMEAREIGKLSDLSCRNSYGIPEPSPECPVVSPDTIDLAIVPCLSASRDGRRLGHGAGYYDRFLAKTEAHRLCICFHELLSEVGEIPMEKYDLYMDQVITEK